MAKFIHTADWQLGKAPHFLSEEARTRFGAARIEVIGAIAELAEAENCEFVVVCGDVFESNQIDRQVLVRALEKMRAATPLVFYLLPGNHDPLDAASIFHSSTFSKHVPDNVVVLESSEPVQVAPGVELVAAPWPNKRPLVDLVDAACENLEPTGVLRVVCGHGAVDAMSPESTNPAHISLKSLKSRIESGVVHYLALGDRHSTTDVGSTGRVWYSGAPEPTDFVEVDPGNALVVDLDHSGVNVESRRVGVWRFENPHWDLSSDEDLVELEEWLDSLNDKTTTIVRASLKGQISVAQQARLQDTLDHHTDLLGGLEVRNTHGDLVVVPDDADLSDFGLSGYAAEALSDIEKLAQSADKAAASTAEHALMLLYRLTRPSK